MEKKQSQPPHDDLDSLLMQLADGELSQADKSRLAACLRDDPSAQAKYVRYVALHAWLEWDCSDHEAEVGHDDKPTVDDQPDATTSPESIGVSAWRHLVRRIKRPTPFSLTISALVMAVLLTALAFLAPPLQDSVTRKNGDEMAVSTPDYWATLTGLEDASWSDEVNGLRLGAKLESGSPLILERGIAELTFRTGARLVLKAPAEFKLIGKNSAKLLRGQATAHVPDSAVGFQLETPSLVIVDLGTEFAASVTEDVVEAHVFQGTVAVQPAEVGAQPAPLRLTAGQAAVFDGQGTLKKRIVAAPQRFERRVGLVNVARGKTIIFGSPSWPNGPSQADSRYLPQKVVDGKVTDELSTFWLGRNGLENEFFTVDLGEVFQINRIELVQTHNGRANDRGTKQYEIWVAKDATIRGELKNPVLLESGELPDAAGTGPQLPVERLQIEKAIEARYVKFLATTFYGSGCGLNEIRVFGTQPISEEK